MSHDVDSFSPDRVDQKSAASLPDYDLARFRADGLTRLPRTRQAPSRSAPGQLFLRGPIPLAWLSTAGSLSGHAIQVGLTLWFEAGLRRDRTVRLRHSVLRRFGVSRWSAYRALKALEQAKLVRVNRRRGRSAIVTLLDADADVREKNSTGGDQPS